MKCFVAFAFSIGSVLWTISTEAMVVWYCTALSVCRSFCTLYILVFSGLVKNSVPLSYCRVRVCDLNFQVSTVSWDCVFIYCVYVSIYLLMCRLFPDSWGRVMHYLFDFSPLFSPLREPIPLFPDVWSRTQNSLFNFVPHHLFCILFGCRIIATCFKSIG